LRYRPTTPVRRAYSLLFALVYEVYTNSEVYTFRNFPSLEDTLQYHHLYKIWKEYSCNLHASAHFSAAIDKRLKAEPFRSHVAIALCAKPWHVLPLACLLRSKKLYDLAFNAGVWHQFQYRYGLSPRRKNVTEHLALQDPLCTQTRHEIDYTLGKITAALGKTAYRINVLDLSHLSDTAKAMWTHYIRHHISESGYCEFDLDFYRDLWHGKIGSAAVIAFYRKDFPGERETYFAKGYFVMRREIRGLLAVMKSCVEPLFISKRGGEFGMVWYDPFYEICNGASRGMVYPWEGEGIEDAIGRKEGKSPGVRWDGNESADDVEIYEPEILRTKKVQTD
jgi:hypothetical protein